MFPNNIKKQRIENHSFDEHSYTNLCINLQTILLSYYCYNINTRCSCMELLRFTTAMRLGVDQWAHETFEGVKFNFY